MKLVTRWGGHGAAALLWLGAAGALVAAVAVARGVGFEVLRHRVEVMVGVVALLVLVAAVPVGPVAARGSLAGVVRAAVGCVIALDVLGAAQVLKVVPPITRGGGPRTGDATSVLVVWVVLLGLVLLAAVRVTGHHTSVRPETAAIAVGCGFAAAAVWLGLAAVLPGVAATVVPAILAMMATGGVAAHLIARRQPDPARPAGEVDRGGPDAAGTSPAPVVGGVVAAMVTREDLGAAGTSAAPVIGGAVAAMVTAAVVATAIDGLLPLGHAWIRNSAPPWEVGTRLVDPVGLLVLAGVLAVVVVVVGRTSAPARR
ncbi:hypothetical protein [Dactylosporangium sp. NPDC000521]|uniref:hypothetical protein n=1 Tax=Dactylosporangium sp. NPDC000521 TaxID=3363975 RepID=UPI00367EE9EF